MQQFEQIFQELYYLSIVEYINKFLHFIYINQLATERRSCLFSKLHWMLIYIGTLDVNSQDSSTDLGNKNPTKKQKKLGTAKFKSFQKQSSFLILAADKTIDKILVKIVFCETFHIMNNSSMVSIWSIVQIFMSRTSRCSLVQFFLQDLNPIAYNCSLNKNQLN